MKKKYFFRGKKYFFRSPFFREKKYFFREKKFDPIYSEKIMQIALLYQSGVNVFGDKAKFDSWLEISNVALGGAKPKSLLDSSFGISLINDELIKIEHGILA